MLKMEIGEADDKLTAVTDLEIEVPLLFLAPGR